MRRAHLAASLILLSPQYTRQREHRVGLSPNPCMCKVAGYHVRMNLLQCVNSSNESYPKR